MLQTTPKTPVSGHLPEYLERVVRYFIKHPDAKTAAAARDLSLAESTVREYEKRIHTATGFPPKRKSLCAQ